MLYSVDGGAWQSLVHPTTIDGKGKVVHVRVVTNDRPEWYFDNTGSMNVHVVRTKG